MSIFDFREVRKANILSCYGNADEILKSNDHTHHTGDHLVHKYIRKEGDKYIYEEPVKKDLDNIKNDISFVATKTANMKSNLDAVLEVAKPKIAEMVEKFIQSQLEGKDARPATAYDIEMYELGVTIDLISAFGRYIKPTDNVSDVSISSRKGVIVLACLVTRDNVKHFMETEMIIAGGHNIQVRHYRYISKTDLPANANHPVVNELIEKKKRLTKAEAIKADIKRNDDYYQRQLKEFNDRKTKTYTDINPTHFQGRLIAWENLNEHAKESYVSKELYDKKNKDESDARWNHHLLRISPKALKFIQSEYEKKDKKLKDKLKEL